MPRRSPFAKNGSRHARASRRSHPASCDSSCRSRCPASGHVNCYAMEDARGITLVDPGLPGPKTCRELQRIMKSGGLPIERVHSVVVTHSHPDHFGQAGQFRKRFGADVDHPPGVPHLPRSRGRGPGERRRPRGDRSAGEGPDRVAAGPGPAPRTVRQADAVGRRPVLDATRSPAAVLGDAQGGRSVRRHAHPHPPGRGRPGARTRRSRVGGGAHARSHDRPPVPLRPGRRA